VFSAPKISDLTVTSCVVDWTPLKPLGSDALTYVLQLQRISSREPDYHEACSNSSRSSSSSSSPELDYHEASSYSSSTTGSRSRSK